MGILDSIKGALFVDEPATPGTPQAPAAQQATHQAAPVVSAPVATYNPGAFTPSAVIDPKFSKHFDEVMEANNLPGNDYLELRKGLSNMQSMPIPENAKYLSAFMMLAVTPDHIKQTAQHYIDVIQADYSKFGEDSKNIRAERVQGKVVQMQQLEQANQERLQQIAALQAQITESQAAIGELNAKMVEDTTKLDTTERNYKHTMEVFINSIKSDVSAIDLHVVPVLNSQQPK